MLETVANISLIAGALLKIAGLLLLAAAIPVVWGFRRASQTLTGTVDRVTGELSPLIKHATSIAENVEHVTSTIDRKSTRLNSSHRL